MTTPSAIYLDNNATTRPHPEVVELMARHWRDSYANPGSRHAPGRRARQVLETARESMAAILGAQPDEVIFTSGGTESNNLAVLGFATGSPGTIALTAGEHPAVLEACLHLEGRGWRLQVLPVDEEGLLVAAQERGTSAPAADLTDHKFGPTVPPLGRGGRGGSKPADGSPPEGTSASAGLRIGAISLAGRTPPAPPFVRGGHSGLTADGSALNTGLWTTMSGSSPSSSRTTRPA